MFLRGQFRVHLEYKLGRDTSSTSVRRKMEFLPQQCAAQSVGAANSLFGILVQTLMAAHCALSPPEWWPKDYGPTAIEKGSC